MKIAILTSGAGDKALRIYDFFKEGNRVTVDCVVTDNALSPAATTLQAEGIPVINILAEGPEATVASLKARDVELIVEDDFSGDVPAAISDAYPCAVVSPTGADEAPMQVVEAITQLTTPPKIVTTPAEDIPTGATEQEQEWADALKINFEPTAEQPEPEKQEQPAQPIDPRQPQQPQQPEPGGDQVPPQMPDTYLIWSVIITILCCLIPGIVAIIYSASVSNKYYAGDIEGAKRASRNAQIWCIVSIVAGIIWATLYTPLLLMVG